MLRRNISLKGEHLKGGREGGNKPLRVGPGRVRTRRVCGRGDVAVIYYNKRSLNYAPIFASSFGFVLTPPGDGAPVEAGSGQREGLHRSLSRL